MKNNFRAFIQTAVLIVIFFPGFGQTSELSKAGIDIIPYPQQVKPGTAEFKLESNVVVAMDKNSSAEDKFTADELVKQLAEKFGVKAVVGSSVANGAIVLTRKGADIKKGADAYSLKIDESKVTIRAGSSPGLFYGVQTLLQLFTKTGDGVKAGTIDIVDWPDTKVRAVHYDTKHHQDNSEYVESFIRTLAKYKINMLVWEWEDKFAYPSHPEIGAPGAFTMEEMQAFTRFAKKYHVQIVPLVQGLGHVSFILKWPQYASLREIQASNFEFCPLKKGSYDLLFDLWQDAIKATPGSSYIHIGSDETYELGECEQCKKKMEEIGKSGLYHLFVGNSAKHLQQQNRKVMVWEGPMNWTRGKNESYKIVPQKGIVLTEEYGFETDDFKYAKQAISMGYPVFAYDPNPGIEPLFLPYFFKKTDEGERKMGHLENSHHFLTSRMNKGIFEGVIRTSWDDSGLPIQAWMMSFLTTAAYSWNAAKPDLNEFTSTYFRNYYGKQSSGADSLYYLLNEASYYYFETLERQVWHYGEIGKTQLPDLPRGDAIEYDPYWNTRYADQVKRAPEFIEKMNRAIEICSRNISAGAENKHDFELYYSIASLVKHTALNYLDLSELERTIDRAHKARFVSYDDVYSNLTKAEKIVEDNLARRNKIYTELKKTWEETTLPKGMSTPDKKYFFRQDRTRHFANRTPDLSYMIVDEQDLKLEEYLEKLKTYTKQFHDTFMNSQGETTREILQ
ncbi:MAG: beta-N-acetylhexosaminidase [Chitinophagaceae bacterium]|nr:beta-N-acetylhexosaminidase [Chitinophagaceae bacterium]